jgi:hypothetical protein
MNLKFEVRIIAKLEYIFLVNAPDIKQAIDNAIRKSGIALEHITMIQAKVLDYE